MSESISISTLKVSASFKSIKEKVLFQIEASLSVNEILYRVWRIEFSPTRDFFIILYSLSFHDISIVFSGFLSISNNFPLLCCLQETSKEWKGFSMKGLERRYYVFCSDLENANILATCS
jgi:hypothetical protein